jgi:hypothetical protein
MIEQNSKLNVNINKTTSAARKGLGWGVLLQKHVYLSIFPILFRYR